MLRKEILATGEFTGVPICVVKNPALQATAKLVYISLINRLGEKQAAYPSQAQIAEDTGLSIRTVKSAVRQLRSTGMISFEAKKSAANRYAINRYVLNDPTPENNPDNTLSRGQALPLTPLSRGQALHSDRGQALPLTSASFAPGTNKRTNKAEPINSTACGREPPTAARETGTATLNLQGDQEVKPKPNQALLKVWKQQGRSLPVPAKIKLCWQLLAIQERETHEVLNPTAIQPDDDLQFLDLFQRTGPGRYRWQELQARDFRSEQMPNVIPRSSYIHPSSEWLSDCQLYFVGAVSEYVVKHGHLPNKQQIAGYIALDPPDSPFLLKQLLAYIRMLEPVVADGETGRAK